MWKVAIVAGMWIFGIVGIGIMQKLEPDNKIYPVWVLIVLMLFSLFTVTYWPVVA